MLVFETHSEMNEAIVAERNKARKEARELCGPGALRSRGTYTLTADKTGRAGPCQESLVCFDHKTKKGLNALIATIEAEYPGVTEIYVEGGFDYAESVRDMNEGIYDPEISVWSLLVWKKS